jgi:prepilin-type processing-associated H-X9-DG protein/prepilin-type N-terminal cleavage/methylation domain-containing protein
MKSPNKDGRRGFSLVELLVSAGIVVILLGVLLPGLGHAREQAKAACCRSNIRQLALANGLYSQESGGVYVPGASGFLSNLHRWHGERPSLYEPFVSARGPLVPYLGPEGAIRVCPAFRPGSKGFEAGNGGYGYNNAYVGVRTATDRHGKVIVVSDLAGATADRVKHPGETVMFTDSAFGDGGLIEYSFAEPRFHPSYGSRADPSIHFRHARTANVAWCDGHVSGERRTFTWSSGIYNGDPARLGLGWFGETDDNGLFDLQ